MKKTITKPKQAASPRSVDRWQRNVLAILADLDSMMVDSQTFDRARARLRRLLASMQRSERR